ncbi:MAG: hypothetical protein WAW96_01820 [Alphaproteobacteria bacterium]
MAYKLKILPKQELLVLAYSREVLPSDFDEFWRAISVSPDYSPDFDDLVLLGPSTDFSEVSWDLTDKEAGKFVESFKSLTPSREKRCAFICADKVLGAMAKMYGAYIHSRSPENVLIEQFATLDQALDWIDASKGASRKLDRAHIIKLLGQMGEQWCLRRSAAA